ncbi:MAG: hypothetical protein PVF07_11230 [Thiogranum sp.]|jgi:hypothetical protein
MKDSDMSRDCNCEGWKEGFHGLEGFVSFGYVQGQYYAGPHWRYCPWCGAELPEEHQPVPASEEEWPLATD